MARTARGHVVVPLIAAFIVGCQSISPAPSVVPAAGSAVDACHLPSTGKQGEPLATLDPERSVEMLVPDGEVIFYASGNQGVLCEAFRSPSGSWSAVSGVTGLDPVAPSALTLDTGMLPGQTNPSTILAGRVPSSADRVQAQGAGITSTTSAVSGRFYVILVEGWESITTIVAQDKSGAEIARLDDPHGLVPPATTAPQ